MGQGQCHGSLWLRKQCDSSRALREERGLSWRYANRSYEVWWAEEEGGRHGLGAFWTMSLGVIFSFSMGWGWGARSHKTRNKQKGEFRRELSQGNLENGLQSM